MTAHRSGRERFATPGVTTAAEAAAWRDALRRHVEIDLATGEGFPSQSGASLSERVTLLRRAALFRGCSTEDLADLAATAYPTRFEVGDALCVEGDEPVECFVIAEGEATVTVGGRLVARVGEDRVVGERGPLERRPRTATVRAATPMTTYVISSEGLLELVSRNPAAARWMYDDIRRRYGD
jgi:signal-transduction protein with cAMP-binding, CBS, and nucleotidyltransferase domain